MRRKIVRILLGVIVVVGLLLAGLVGWARHSLSRDYSELPLPAIVADSSPAGVHRGEVLFQSLCMECHGGPDGRATGKRLDEIPAFLGTMWSANLAHPETGVHQRTDGQLARVLRHGVLPDGRLSAAMSSFKRIGDADVAAILGYIRSRPPVFEPGGDAQPRTQISVVGSLVLTYAAKINPDAERTVPVPPREPSVEYGRYLVNVLDCATCHTPGFGADKLGVPEALSGGFEFTDPTGTPIFSRNITFDAETGIGSWSEDQFDRALTRGIRPEGTLVRKPMPLFSRLERVEIEALYTFLRSMPKVKQQNKPGGHPLEHAKPGDSADVLFVNVGCVSCHGVGAPFRDKLGGALGKTDADVADWILHAQTRRPGTTMPSFEGALAPEQAEDLAKYVKTLAAQRPQG